MAMFDDPKKELKRLEEQLLKEDEWFETELKQAKALIGDVPAPKKAAPAGKRPAAAPTARKAAAPGAKKAAPKEVPVPKKKSNRGLVILACLETLGIVGVVAYWLLFLL